MFVFFFCSSRRRHTRCALVTEFRRVLFRSKQAQLLTVKPVLYVCNVEEAHAATGNAHSAAVFARAEAEGAQAVIVSAAIESELVGMEPDERMLFLEEMGLPETGTACVIGDVYVLRPLLTFFTFGLQEAKRE